MPSTEGNRILIIDDTAFTRDVTTKLLIEMGFSSTIIDQCTNGKQGWAAIQRAYNSSWDYGVVLCDWNMPEMNGLELLQKVREDEQTKEQPFILVTTESEKDKIIEAAAYKVTNYIIKPISKDILVPKISHYFDFLLEK